MQMKKFTLLIASLFITMGAMAQTVVTAINTSKYYTIECRSGHAHNTARFIADDGTVINGQSSFASYFVFEGAEGVENEYYPVKLKAEFKLSKLPTEDEFLKICEPEEEEEAS